jgi:hypothetical protein
MFAKLKTSSILIATIFYTSCNASEINLADYPNLQSTSTYSYSIGKSIMGSDFSIIYDSFLDSDGKKSCVIPVYNSIIKERYCISSVINYQKNKMETYFYAVRYKPNLELSKFSDVNIRIDYSSSSSVEKNMYIFNNTPILNQSGKVISRSTCRLSINDISDPEFPVLDIESTKCVSQKAIK